MKATAALPELWAYYEKEPVSYMKQYALRAIGMIDPEAGDRAFLAYVRRTGTHGPSFFTEMSRIANGYFMSPELVPYLVEACRGLRMVQYSDREVLDWRPGSTRIPGIATPFRPPRPGSGR